jgi:hypothetical protein
LCQSKVWSVNEYQKQADMVFKIIGACWAAHLFLDVIKILPNFISDKIVNMLLEKIGL